jgi:hypothetical protein
MSDTLIEKFDFLISANNDHFRTSAVEASEAFVQPAKLGLTSFSIERQG